MTIILKDVFCFGREQIGMYSLTQVIYPSLDVTFIAILEPTNFTTGEGMEMLFAVLLQHIQRMVCGTDKQEPPYCQQANPTH